MEFKTGYWHALDKQSERNDLVSPEQLGTSPHPAKDQLEGLKGRIRMGARNVELGFMGSGKGNLNQGNTTPGMYGKDERKAMKELAKINKVNLSVHGSAGVTGFAGFDHRSGKFDEQSRQKNINEMKRAIDFAADTTDGGAVVVHTGEFPRALSEIPSDKGKMKYYPTEDKEATLYLVNKKTGDMIGGLKKNMEVWVPEKKNGLVVTERTKEGFLQPKMEKQSFKHFEKIAEDLHTKGMTGTKADPAYLMYKEMMEGQKADDQAWVRHHTLQYEEAKKAMQELDAGIKIKEKTPSLRHEVEIDKQKKDNLMHTMEYHKGNAVGKMQAIKNIDDKLENISSLSEYGKKKTADSIANLGIFAMDKSKGKKLPKPIFIAPENIWAEYGYGAHPDELKEIIVSSRNRFAEKLTQKKITRPDGSMIDNPLFKPGISKDKAKKLAQEHIRATFDIGHANTWRKHFQGDDKGFKKWLLGKANDLQKSGVLGHVHMSDNFGYEDEHGTLGQGTVPMKEFLSNLKKGGYTGTIMAEPGHNDYKALLGAWRALESPVYRVDHTSRSWTDVEGGYFGRTFSPNYTFKSYLPIGQREERLTWSDVPLE